MTTQNFITYYTFSFLLLLSSALSAQLYQLEKLNNSINTPDHDEITPVISRDGRTLCFTRVGYPIYNKTLIENGRDLSKELSFPEYQDYLRTIYSEIAGRRISDPENSDFNQDIWIARSFGNDFDFVIHPDYPLNNALPNSICAITPDENSVVVINQFDPDGGMKKGFSFCEKRSNNGWSHPQAIYIDDYYNLDTDVGLTMSNNGHIFILSMERKDSKGDNDLYVCFRTGNHTWSKPINLGRVINSKYRETTPFLTVDNQTLYFSSNRPGSMGGNDIYYTKRLDDTWKKWSKPVRLDSPINSTADDSQPFFNTLNGYLYFTSKRDGSSDIFRVRIAKPVKETVTVFGRVFNPKTKEAIPGASVKRSLENSEYYTDVALAEDGRYQIEMPKGNAYDLIAEKQGHIGEKSTVEFKKNYLYFRDYEVNLVLRPIEAGTKLNLKPIYFERSKPNILEKSYPALDELADYLKENKSYYVRIEGHTDNQGEDEDLLALSQARAEAVKDYLVYKKFIKPVRLDAIGHGDTQPVTNNSTEELRAKNRRVEAIIMVVSTMLD